MPDILLVEDARMLANLLRRRMTNELGYNVVWAASYAEARDTLDRGDDFDVAVLDLTLPDSQHAEIVDLVAPRISSVVFTGDLSEGMRRSIWEKSVADYVLKESAQSVDYLLAAIRRLVGNKGCKAMVVENSQALRNYLVRLLRTHRFQVLEASDGQAALDTLRCNMDVRIMVTDHRLPGMDGLELLGQARGLCSKEDMAVICLADERDDWRSAKFIKNGANDYLNMPFSAEEFYCRINHNLEMLDHIRFRKEAAYTDFLTGLYNRKYFFELGRKIFARHRRGEGGLCVAMVDIDRFKQVNDTWGHEAGDMVLKEVAQAMSCRFRESDIVARFGGEEFCVLLDSPAPEDMHAVFDLVRREIAERYVDLEGEFLSVTASIGVCAEPGESLEDMVRVADARLYEAKRTGRDKVVSEG